MTTEPRQRQYWNCGHIQAGEPFHSIVSVRPVIGHPSDYEWDVDLGLCCLCAGFTVGAMSVEPLRATRVVEQWPESRAKHVIAYVAGWLHKGYPNDASVSRVRSMLAKRAEVSLDPSLFDGVQPDEADLLHTAELLEKHSVEADGSHDFTHALRVRVANVLRSMAEGEGHKPL